MRKIVRLAYVLAIFILIDLTATIFWVANDLGHEANPIMAFFLEVSPLLFVIAKLGLSAVGIWILYFFISSMGRSFSPLFNYLINNA